MNGPIGDRVLIDGKDAYLRYHADLIEYPTITPGQLTASYGDFPGILIPYKTTQAAKTATWSFYVHGSDREECEINTAALIAACQQCTLSIEGRRLEYWSVLTGSTSEPTGIDQFNRVTLTFACIQRGNEQVCALPQDRVNVNGLFPAPCRITLNPLSALSSFSILGITVSGLSAKDEFVIDGLSRRVTRNGTNAFLDTDLIDFPSLSPGWNTLNMSTEIPGQIAYYPIY